MRPFPRISRPPRSHAATTSCVQRLSRRRHRMLALAAVRSLVFVVPRVSSVPRTAAFRTSVVTMGRKPGVMEPADLAAFVESAGEKLIVVDVRNPDFSVEPGDGKSNEKAPLTACGTDARPRAVNAAFDRGSNSLDLGKIPTDDKSTPIITHCGGGGRGQRRLPDGARLHQRGQRRRAGGRRVLGRLRREVRCVRRA